MTTGRRIEQIVVFSPDAEVEQDHCLGYGVRRLAPGGKLMSTKTIDEALEWMREQNRAHFDPAPEESFEETLQGLAAPLMQAGLVSDVCADVPSDLEIEACRAGLGRQVAEKRIEGEIGQARLYLRDHDILVGSRVHVPCSSESVVYLGLVPTEYGVAAVVRLVGDLLSEVHYSRLTKA